MPIRIEFADHKSPQCAWARRLCKRFPTYKEIQEEGLAIYSIEFAEKDLAQFRAIHAALYTLPRVAYFLDGRLISKEDLFRVVSERESRHRQDRWAAEQQERERLRALFYRNPSDAFLARLKKYGLLGNPN